MYWAMSAVIAILILITDTTLRKREKAKKLVSSKPQIVYADSHCV